jgi:hypothetical protein
MVTNLIMDKYKMPYDEARAAYEDVLVPYQQKRDETAKRASFIGNKYNLDTLFTSKRESPGSESARSLTDMITPTEGGVVSENPYFKQGVGMEGFLSTTNAGRAVSDPNAPNRYRIAGDADLGRVDTPYNANTFNQQFKDIKAAFEEDPKLMAEIVGMSLAQDYVKTALPIAANAVPGGAALANTEMGKDLNKSIMQFTLANAPVSDAAKETVRGDWLADPTLTSYIDPALTGLSLATGGVTGAFPVTSKLLKAGKAVATSEKTARAAGNVRDASGALAGTVLSAGGMGGMYNIGKAQRAADAARNTKKGGEADDWVKTIMEDLDQPPADMSIPVSHGVTPKSLSENPQEELAKVFSHASAKWDDLKSQDKEIKMLEEEIKSLGKTDVTPEKKLQLKDLKAEYENAKSQFFAEHTFDNVSGVTEDMLKQLAGGTVGDAATLLDDVDLTKPITFRISNIRQTENVSSQVGRKRFVEFKDALVKAGLYTSDEVDDIISQQRSALRGSITDLLAGPTGQSEDLTINIISASKKDPNKKIYKSFKPDPDHLIPQSASSIVGIELLDTKPDAAKVLFNFINSKDNFQPLVWDQNRYNKKGLWPHDWLKEQQRAFPDDPNFDIGKKGDTPGFYQQKIDSAFSMLRAQLKETGMSNKEIENVFSRIKEVSGTSRSSSKIPSSQEVLF